MKDAYYNEFDIHAAAGLRELIKANVIAPGDVDTRSICDVEASDLKGYTQCHFFAGAGVWSYALRQCGWPDDRPVWSGSCPCQAFSVAGEGKGTGDHRDLWPVFAALIRERGPDTIIGEQVSAAIGFGWLDRLRTDLEAEDYAIGSLVCGAHSAGADHIRQRVYWVADSNSGRRGQRTELNGKQEDDSANRDSRGEHPDGCGGPRRLAHPIIGRLGGGDQPGPDTQRQQMGEQQNRTRSSDKPGDGRETPGRLADSQDTDWRSGERGPQEGTWPDGERRRRPSGCGDDRGMANASSGGLGIDGGAQRDTGHDDQRGEADGRMGNASGDNEQRDSVPGTYGEREPAGGSGGDDGRMGSPILPRLEGHAGNGLVRPEPGRIGAGPDGPAPEASGNFWSGAIWIPCRDGKARRVEPGIPPLVARTPRDLVHLRDQILQGDAEGQQEITEAEANSTDEARTMRLKWYGNACNAETAIMFVRAFMEGQGQ
jgi:DNA (cytosine-5)-methyltransferase 1